MTEKIVMIVFGIFFVYLGSMNYRGNINSIHWYNRRKITEKTKKPYGKLIGMSTITIGTGLIVSGILEMVFKFDEVKYVMIGAVVIGLALMLYAQFKYNKGIF